MVSEDSDRVPRSAQYAVKVDGTVWIPAAMNDRHEAERAAINEILTRLAPQHRAVARRILEDRESTSTFSSSNDPEIARLLGLITAIRAADNAEIVRKAAEDRQKDELDAPRRVRVLVALVGDLGSAGIRATVIRRPDDGGRPLLLLSAASFTSTDLAFGLRLAANSVPRFGIAPSVEHKLQFRDQAPQSGLRHQATLPDELAALLRRSPSRLIPGIGTVQALDIVTTHDVPGVP